MANHSLAMEKLFHHEGGFVHDPDDLGGATNMGITLETLIEWRKRDVTVQDVKDLAESEAESIYIEKYWNAMRLDEINSQVLAEAVMDFGVNAGTSQAVKALQKAANWVYEGDRGGSLVEDGLIGPMTIQFVNVSRQTMLLIRYFIERIQYYHDITRSRRKNEKFLYAWVKRSLDYIEMPA